jgi:hypothetical protein
LLPFYFQPYIIISTFTMKLINTFWILILLSLTTYGQNVGIGTSSPAALLDVSGTNNGILIPRVALTGTGSAGPLTSPAISTLVYNTATVSNVTPGYYYWSGTAWIRLIDNASLAGATTVSNTSSANTLSTTVNGVTGTGVNIINSNALGMSGNNLTATINGIGSSAQSLSGLSLSGDVTGTLAGSTVGRIQGTGVAISSLATNNLLQYNGTNWVNVTPASVVNNIYNSDGTLTGNRTVTMAGDNLTFSSTTGNLIFNPSSTGYVGIGTAAPAAEEEINLAGTSSLATMQQNVSAHGLALSTTYANGNYFPGIEWYGTNDNPTKPKAGIWSYGDNSGSKLYFGTSNFYATGITNAAMVIDPSGRVGVGVTSPVYALDVAGVIQATASGYPIIQHNNTNPATYGLDVYTENGTEKAFLGMGGSTESLGANVAYAQDGFSMNSDGAGAMNISNRGASKTIYLNTGTESTSNFHTVTINSGNVGINNTSPAAILDVTSTTSGFLPPRMSTGQRTGISAPVAGMMIYNTDNSCLQFYNGTIWVSECPGGLGAGVSATGGTVNNTISGYTIQTYTTSGTFTVTSPGNIQLLVVAGGGGGGRYGGGGGGGGVVYYSSYNVSPGSYTITVGNGGAGWAGDAQSGGNGGNGGSSSFGNPSYGTVTATGGGGGGNYGNNSCSAGAAGGSGGGGGCNNLGGCGAGAGTSGQGNNGSAGSGSAYQGGGGGGAGQAGGANGTSTGGNGLSYNISGSTAYYGGGGGGCYAAQIAGGNGGGGSGYPGGAVASSVVDGAVNTGGGGGGTRDATVSGTWRAGNGGSGIVIVRYPK